MRPVFDGLPFGLLHTFLKDVLLFVCIMYTVQLCVKMILKRQGVKNYDQPETYKWILDFISVLVNLQPWNIK